MYLSICLSIYLAINLSIYPSIYLSFYLSIYLSTYLPTYLSIYLSIYLSLGLSVCLSIYLSICKLENLAILRDFFVFQSWQHQNAAILRDFLNVCTRQRQKRSNSARLFIFRSWQHQKQSKSARLPQFLNLTMSRTKQFCETSAVFELDNIQNEAILRDLFNFWIWPHQKQNNSARLPSKMESWVQRWQPRTNAFCDFSTPPL